jgi:hypothetical protein
MKRKRSVIGRWMVGMRGKNSRKINPFTDIDAGIENSR